jgi:hypothetical protein
MMSKVLILTVAMFGAANAYCPNGCSGHGTCNNAQGMKDTCTCFTHLDGGEQVAMWTGADCSLRTCPTAGAWAASPSANNDHVSSTVECAGRGKCDRSSGECACDTGYAGSACQRTVCPNNCNGHGTCQTLSQLADDFSHNADDGVASNLFATPNSGKDCVDCVGTQSTGAIYDNAWDAARSVGCKCDAGYRGSDCALKECPSGDDPLEGHGGSKGRACSGRGTCDYESGMCVCYTGFYGNRCQSLTVLI